MVELTAALRETKFKSRPRYQMNQWVSRND